MSASVARPRMTVVILVAEVRQRLAKCLATLFGQRCIADLEILVMDHAAPGARPVPGANHPAVRMLEMSPDATFGESRTRAVREARGEIIAFLEEHTFVNEVWAEKLLAAHEGPWTGVGAVFDNGNPGEGYSDAIGLLSYGTYYAPHPRGDFSSVAAHNSSYKRAALLAYDDELPTLLANDYTMVKRMHAEGHRFAIEPDAIIYHLQETTFVGIAEGFYHYYRHHGHRRAIENRWPVWKRALYVVCTPIIPLYYLGHTLPYLWRKNPRYVGTMLANIGLVYGCQFTGALGQAMGLMFGPADSELKFSKFEMLSERGNRCLEVDEEALARPATETCLT